MPPLTLLQLGQAYKIESLPGNVQNVSYYLNVINVSENFVAYKIKSTSSDGYRFLPSTGVIGPFDEQDVQIILLPLQEPPCTSGALFLVQAAEVDSTDVELTREFWMNVSKELLQEHHDFMHFKPKEEAAVSPQAAAASSIVPPSQYTSLPSSQPSFPPSLTPFSNPSPPSPSPLSSPPSTDSLTALITSDLQCPSAFPPPAVSDLEAKYNDLLQSYLALEKQKTAVANELSESQQQNEALRRRLKSSLWWAKRCPFDFFN